MITGRKLVVTDMLLQGVQYMYIIPPQTSVGPYSS